MDANADDEDGVSEDLAVELAHTYLSRVVAHLAREAIDHPHIVICRDPQTGVVSYSGPFSDGLEALVFADREVRLDGEINTGPPMEFSVALLLPVPASDAG